MTPDAIKKESIHFQNNNKALAVLPVSRNKTEDIVSALDIPPYQGVILILGGEDGMKETVLPHLTQLFGRGIARAAREANALIIDGGVKAGVVSFMGEGVASYGYQSCLIGVAPKGKITYSDNPAGTPLEPNHSHFILTEGPEWGSETGLKFNLVRALTAKGASGEGPEGKSGRPGAKNPVIRVPGLAILAGGGIHTRAEVLRAVRLNLSLIVIEGSGGLADELASAHHKKEKHADDPVMAEILAEGELHFHSLSHSVKGIEKLIVRELGVDKVLGQAWETYADYDLNARYQQRRYDQLQLAILIVGVVGTALALFQQVQAPKLSGTGALAPVSWDLFGPPGRGWSAPGGWWVLRQVLIIIPILLLVLASAAHRFKQGTKWLLLRAGAEAMKREIYLYRTRTRYYQDKAEQQLSRRMGDITRKTMGTEVNSSSLQPYNKTKGFPPVGNTLAGGDDGFSYLMPDRYVEWRLSDQLHSFKKRSLSLEKQIKWVYWLTFLFGGLGAYLAAVNQQVWIALTIAMTAAMTTFLGYRQTEASLLKYNQAVTDLANIRAWWNALSAEEQARPLVVNALITHTEQVLQLAGDGGMHLLHDALADLRQEKEVGTTQQVKEEEPEPAVFPAPEIYSGQVVTIGNPAGDRYSADPALYPALDHPETREESKLILTRASGNGMSPEYREEENGTPGREKGHS